jgi:hypothetical protein
MSDFIPLVTDEQRVVFCRATEKLCPDLQRLIWDMYMKTFEPECPPAPNKIRVFIENEEFFY